MQHLKMTCYSVQPKDRIFVKGYGFLLFAKNMSKNFDKSVSNKCSLGMLACVAKISDQARQKLLDHAEQSAANANATAWKRAIQKQLKELMIWLVIKWLMKLHKSQ